jgi:hypothetical protein
MPQTSRNNNPLYYNSFINDYSTIMKSKSDDTINLQNTNNLRDSINKKNNSILILNFQFLKIFSFA